MVEISEWDGSARGAISRVGQVLCGEWRLDELLGRGAVSCVYAATHRSGRRAALKLLRPDLSRDAQASARLVRDAYLANGIRHHGVVRVLGDAVAEDGTPFLVMDLLDGETIEDKCEARSGPFEAREVLTLARDVLDLLVCAHANGILHTDITPSNLFRTRSGELRLFGFGLAQALQLLDVTAAPRVGAILGSPAFMPPEQARGSWGDVGPSSDLWALGATMFRLSSGRRVREGETSEMLLAAMSLPAKPLSGVAPWLPANFCALVDRALALDPAHRFPTTLAMKEAVEAALATLDSVLTADDLMADDEEAQTRIVPIELFAIGAGRRVPNKASSPVRPRESSSVAPVSSSVAPVSSSVAPVSSSVAPPSQAPLYRDPPVTLPLRPVWPAFAFTGFAAGGIFGFLLLTQTGIGLNDIVTAVEQRTTASGAQAPAHPEPASSEPSKPNAGPLPTASATNAPSATPPSKQPPPAALATTSASAAPPSTPPLPTTSATTAASAARPSALVMRLPVSIGLDEEK